MSWCSRLAMEDREGARTPELHARAKSHPFRIAAWMVFHERLFHSIMRMSLGAPGRRAAIGRHIHSLKKDGRLRPDAGGCGDAHSSRRRTYRRSSA